MGALRMEWLGRWRGGRGRRGLPPRPLLVASRDLPPVEADAARALPRSPEPFSDTEMLFAHRATERAMEQRDAMPVRQSAAAGTMMRGADLRALLDRFERDCARHEARLGKLFPGRPALRLVTEGMPTRSRFDQAGDLLTPEADAALAAALETLRKLSLLARR